MAEKKKIVRLADVGELENILKKDLAEEEAKGKDADTLFCEDVAGELTDLESLPTIDPESLRPVSEWELNPHRFSCEHFRCKLCHHISCLTDAFCGGCGAKMKNAGTKAKDLPLPIDEYEYKKGETIPQNPDYDEWNLPPECRVAVEKAHREAAQKQEEQQRGRKTLHMLAEKTIKETTPWELAWEDVQFGLEYYKQPLPGGAMFWKRIDQNRQHAGIMNYDDYAIILQDGKFFTCGWIPKISVIAELVRYFVLK